MYDITALTLHSAHRQVQHMGVDYPGVDLLRSGHPHLRYNGVGGSVRTRPLHRQPVGAHIRHGGHQGTTPSG